MTFETIIQLMRVHQYVKNVFVFTPLLFSQQYTQLNLTHTVVAFIAFCLTSSAVYIFNDLMDLEEDKNHPRKRLRPLASGKTTISTAKFLMIVLAGLGIATSFYLPLTVTYLLLAYLLMNSIYSIKLKHIAIIDLFLIATGFVLRVISGAQAADVYLSMWLVLMTFLLALFLALAKRRDDVLLANEGHDTRKNIDGYNLEFINASMVAMSAVLIVCYILYTISVEVIERMGAPYLYVSTAFVILGIMRYMQLTFVNQVSDSPTRILLGDRFLQLTLVLWLLTFFGLTYI